VVTATGIMNTCDALPNGYALNGPNSFNQWAANKGNAVSMVADNATGNYVLDSVINGSFEAAEGLVNTTPLGENDRRTSGPANCGNGVPRHVVPSKRRVDNHHSYLKATIGSTNEARRAGKYAAPADTAVIVTIASTGVKASVAVMPNNRVVRNRVQDTRRACQGLHKRRKPDLADAESTRKRSRVLAVLANPVAFGPSR